MNKTVVIVGALAVLGVGVFFYFKPKATETTNTGTVGTGASLSNTGAGTTNVPPTGTVISTPEQLADIAKKLAEAKVLAKKIADLKIKRSKIESKPVTQLSSNPLTSAESGTGMSINTKRVQISAINKQIKALEEQLNKLGYTEVNGNIVRIENL